MRVLGVFAHPDVDRSGPGESIGEQGIASGRPRNAHVVSLDDVTSLVFLPAETQSVDDHGEPARRARTRSLPSGDQVDAPVSTCIDVSEFAGHRLRATAAHRPQYPIDPEVFPEHIVREMFGVEYVIQVLADRDLSSPSWTSPSQPPERRAVSRRDAGCSTAAVLDAQRRRAGWEACYVPVVRSS